MQSNTDKNHGEIMSPAVCKAILVSVKSNLWLKAMLSTMACAWLYIFPDTSVMIPVFSLVILDSIVGVMRAVKDGEFVSSRGFIRSATKVTVYLVMLGAGGIIDREFPGEYASTVIKSFLMITEAISIMENIKGLGWPVPTSVFKILNMMADKSTKKKK